MVIAKELTRHHVHWFVLGAIVLYAFAAWLRVRPVPVDSLPHAEIGTQRRLEIDKNGTPRLLS